MLGGDQLGQQVLNHVERWVPAQKYGHENKYQSELQDYLDDALNNQGGMTGMGLGMGGGSGGHAVSTEHGTSYGDVVVDNTVGIELKRNFSNSQKKKLRGQLEDYADNYDYVIACACGIDDMDGWRELENIFTNRQQGLMDVTQFAFVIKHREDMGDGGRGVSGGGRGGGDGGLFGGDGLF